MLGVSARASLDEIRKAYRLLAKQHHPDASNDPGTTETFILVKEAYETLSDPERRAAYDSALEWMSVKKPAPRKPTPKPEWPRTTASYGSSIPRAPHEPPRVQTAVTTPEALRLTALISRGRFNEAEALALRLLEREPKVALAHAVLADIAVIRGQIRRAAELYAVAAQLDPSNRLYMRKHEEVLRTLRNPVPAAQMPPHPNSFSAPLSGLFVVGVCAVYVAVSRESALLPSFAPISSWTLGLLVMLFLCGVTAGACLAVANLVERFGAVRGGSVTRISPTIAIGLVAVVNFWAAGMLYVAVGVSQDAFNSSLSRLLAACALVTLILALASSASPLIAPFQTVLWGGNVVYAGALSGWMVADALLRE